jgi:hypothetical protein
MPESKKAVIPLTSSLPEDTNRGVTDFYQRDGKIFLRELDATSMFPNLSWHWNDDVPILKGVYQFQTEYKGISFKDNFHLEFFFPQTYPDDLPTVKEIDSKIPSTFHHFIDGSLCLCTPAEQYMIFSRAPRLENYIRNLLNPYLLGWLWYQQFNEMPWGERAHGLSGLLESYQELLNIKNWQCLLDFMYKYIRNELFQRQKCPCGSGLPFKKCHRNLIIRLENCLPNGQLSRDFINIFRG